VSEFSKELEDYFCRFTFGQFVTLILLELVTLFFVFYLGARYGPDLIGGREETRAPVALDRTIEKPPVDYTFPETLSDHGTEVVKVKPSGVSLQEFERPRLVIPVPERVDEKVEQPEKIERAPRTVKEAAPLPEEGASPDGRFSIQVGAYRSAAEASSQVDRWKTRGYSTFMTVGDVAEQGTWYRVRIGRFKNRDEAKLFLEKFKAREKQEAMIVKGS